VRITEWLPDDPYPRADVEVVDDGEWTADAGIALDGARRALERVVELATALGGTVDPGILDLPGPPAIDQWLLAARAPIAELDRFALLRADTPERRLELLAAELVSIAEVLATRLGGG
jgi:Lon protease-like protein